MPIKLSIKIILIAVPEFTRAIMYFISVLNAIYLIVYPEAVTSVTQVKLYPVASRIPKNKFPDTETRVVSVLVPPTPMLPSGVSSITWI